MCALPISPRVTANGRWLQLQHGMRASKEPALWAGGIASPVKALDHEHLVGTVRAQRDLRHCEPDPARQGHGHKLTCWHTRQIAAVLHLPQPQLALVLKRGLGALPPRTRPSITVDTTDGARRR